MPDKVPPKVVVLEPRDENYFPIGSSDSMMLSSSRHPKGSIIVEVVANGDAALSELRANASRYAEGNAEIWDQFPELRPEFKTKVLRAAIPGELEKSVALVEVVPGDNFVDRGVWFPGHSTAMERTLSLSPFIADAGDICEVSPQAFEARNIEPTIELLGKGVYFLDAAAFWNAGGPKLGNGISFYSPRELLERSDLMSFVSPSGRFDTPAGSFPHFPHEFTGALVFDEASEDEAPFSEARTSRLLAALAITQGVRGGVCGEFRKRPNGWMSRFRMLENWWFPFLSYDRAPPFSADATEAQLSKIIEIVANTPHSKFMSAKEDCRLLALETAADSRGGAAVPLHFTHVWMAVERLLPFRHETSVQICIALAALAQASDRAAMFERVKKSYALRSAIAHGYGFKRDTEMYSELNWIADVFRTLFQHSLNLQDPENLRDLLLEQVLSAKPFAFGGDAPVREG